MVGALDGAVAQTPDTQGPCWSSRPGPGSQPAEVWAPSPLWGSGSEMPGVGTGLAGWSGKFPPSQGAFSAMVMSPLGA